MTAASRAWAAWVWAATSVGTCMLYTFGTLFLRPGMLLAGVGWLLCVFCWQGLWKRPLHTATFFAMKKVLNRLAPDPTAEVCKQAKALCVFELITFH